MPDAYDLYDGRFLQEAGSASSAGGLHTQIGPVPAGKVWTIFQAYLSTSISETQNFWFSVVSRAQQNYPVTLPQEFTTVPLVSQVLPMLREGMELKLFPEEYLSAFRAAATEGSTIKIYAKFSETDLPLYRYIEPQRQIPTRRQAHGQSLAPTSGGTSVVHPPPPPPPTERGRRGSPEPK